jgi:GDP-L-fucose synthase
VVAAARVGGILANAASPAEFLYDNLMIAANVIEAAHGVGVAKLLFLGSSCVYPRLAPQPMREECLLDGPLEPSNQWYAVAKIAGLKLCQAYRRQYGCDFISAMPSNLYGPGDDFDLLTSHVVPALMAQMHAAQAAGTPEVEIWGSGRPRREFLHVDAWPMPASICSRCTATRSRSTSAAVRISPSPSWPSRCGRWSGSQVASATMRSAPTARHESCSTSRA